MKRGSSLYRGQAWGVMEVLIAVIIMGFSMAIVYYAINNIQSTQCVESLQSQTVSLENALLDVALGSPPTQREVVYNFPQCSNLAVEAVRFVRYTDPSLCTICPGQYGSCWIIEPTVYDYQTKSYYNLVNADVCVNMPADISLATINTGDTGNGCTTDPNFQNVFAPSNAVDSACPNVLPDGSAIPASLQNTNCNAPPTQTSSGVPTGSIYSTFGLHPGVPSQVVFELVKTAAASQGGIIDICAKNSTI